MKKLHIIRDIYVTVDDEDYDYVKQFHWFYYNTGYAFRCTYHGYVNGKQQRKQILMHRDLMKPGTGMDVDHIDGDGLNNSRSNLRVATRAQNMYNKRKQHNNKSGYIGVHWSKEKNKWRAVIRYLNKEQFVGYFDDIVKAAKARDLKALELHGDFAMLNFQRPDSSN